MGSNFLKVETGKDSSDRWRNILSVAICIIALGGGWFWYQGGVVFFVEEAPKHAPESAMVADTLKEDTTFEQVEGGDITQPPPDTAPVLPFLEGSLLSMEDLSAVSAIVKDTESGATLYAKNEYEPHPIASLTKLMSALVILEAGPDWEQKAAVISDDVIDTHMYAGEVYTVESLWRAGLVGSSNKAMLSLVDAMSWPREAFVERMNQKAIELGMTKTHFVEPTGLDARNVSSAADIALLLDEALKVNEIRQTLLLPEYYLVSTDGSERHHIWNTNWLLLGWIDNRFFDLRGGKTGYIPAAGYNFSMQVANNTGDILSVVILGADTHEARFTEGRDVAMSVFDNYSWPSQRVAGEKIEHK